MFLCFPLMLRVLFGSVLATMQRTVQDFSRAPIRHPYKQLWPAQMVIHRGGHCGGSVLRCLLAVSVVSECKVNKSPVGMCSPQDALMVDSCAEKGSRKT